MEVCAEYRAPDSRVQVRRAASWVQRRPCRPGQARRRVRCKLQQAPSTCAGTSTRGQRGKYGALLTHASIRLPCPTLHLVVPLSLDPL